MKFPSIDFHSRTLRRSSPFLLYIVISLLVIALYADRHQWLENLEVKIQDKMIQLARKQGHPQNVAIVTIDDAAIAKVGEWPWNSERIAYLLGSLAEYEPAVIGLDFELPVTELSDPAGHALLAEVIEQTGNVVASLDFLVTEQPQSEGGGEGAPEYLLKSSYIIPNPEQERDLLDYPPLFGSHLRAPTETLSKACWNMGHVNSIVDPDGVVRTDPLVIKYGGHYFPSMAVQLARAVWKVNRVKIGISAGDAVRLGSVEIPTDDRGRMLLEYWGEAGTFPTFSATRILEGKEDPARLKGLVVLVGVSATKHAAKMQTPGGSVMNHTERIANAVECIMRKRFVAQLKLTTLLELVVLMGIGLFCAVVLPRITIEYRVIVLAVFLFVIVNFNYILYSSFHLVTKTLYPSLEILLFLLFSPAVKMRKSAIESLDDEPTLPRRRPRRRSVQPGVRSIGKPGKQNTVHSSRRPRLSGQAIGKSELAQTQIITEEAIEAARTMSGDGKTPSPPSPPSPPPPPLSEQTGQSAPKNEATPPPAPPVKPSVPENQSPAAGATPAAAKPVDSEMPTQLGRYEVLAVVGQGAMGTVFRGQDPAIGRLVALKTIRFGTNKGSEQVAELRERFYREAQAAGKLSHPNIVTIYDVGTEDDLQYIAMEFIEGCTLEEVVNKKQALNYRIIAKIIMQVCSGLDYAHKQGIVHRDIKPANILVLDNFEVKVADFGIARLNQPNMTMTQTGMALGTPNYISPEQLKGEKVDHRSDIFSMGVVMYELVTRKKPFTGDNISQLIYNILNQEPEKPSAIDHNIPGIFDVTITRCLAKDPYQRYQSAGEIAADLIDFVSSFESKSYKI